jgi:Immunity protein 21
MNWIQTTGGPLVLLPQIGQEAWGGAEGVASDYDKACRVSDYLGVVDFRGQLALVLGDEPHQATILACIGEQLIVRWVYAQNANAIVERVCAGRWGLPVEVLAWSAQESDFVLRDSALPGRVLGTQLEVSLPTGNYCIETYAIKEAEVSAIIHRLSIALPV